MSHPIIAVYPPKVTEHPHIAQYIRDIHINPHMNWSVKLIKLLWIR